jgi:hypothetical protein
MTCCCNSNPAQYERNRRFRHLVHVLGWKANGAKLPSERLRLNASKSESRLDIATIIQLPTRWEARLCSVCLWLRCWRSPGKRHPRRSEWSGVCHNRNYPEQRRGAKSFADDLVTGRGVVLSRAATTLRSVETKPTIGRFVLLSITLPCSHLKASLFLSLLFTLPCSQ